MQYYTGIEIQILRLRGEYNSVIHRHESMELNTARFYYQDKTSNGAPDIQLNSNVESFLEATKEYDKATFPAKLLVKLSENSKDRYNVKNKSRDILITDRLPFRKEVDSGVYFCCYCETLLTIFNYTREHVVPVSRGGKNTKSNLRACCSDCNSEKDSMMLHTYIQFLNLKLDEFEAGSQDYTLLKIKIKNANNIAIGLGLIYEPDNNR